MTKLSPITKDNTLILTVGLPYSGKSTWARLQAHPIVNPDAVRMAVYGQRFWPDGEKIVWAIVDQMVRSLFMAGHRAVILDACNTTRKRRAEWYGDRRPWKVRFHHIPTPENVCTSRAIDAGDKTILPIIERMADQFEPVGEDEGQELEIQAAGGGEATGPVGDPGGSIGGGGGF